ncbi:DUF294 nucleotidyltransferase-like domain-containing protein [Pelagicoccus sp. SDUM812005]|uniref:DUF294 nucleotidyltransferase-like domain-containing protein n=1 Tax=Pelagicoccus sp. SDUM812005 TaxID=3041257 RepID=UPI00280E84F4|nr:DUF294 nucleotidyltransferase-like domain-containing protein [Pelagicoccus sp. SDUM812005]MDQ8181030.1 DUF294 nucleotidyltransferase-like domain-containing protein [Pelagicoccus sp. SDUM812005]
MTTPNVIPNRIAASLAKYPPFSHLGTDEVFELASKARVRALVSGDTLFEQGDPPPKDLFFLENGRIEYYWANEGKSELVDVRDIGDLIGLTAVLETSPHRVTASVAEDCLLYAIEAERFLKLIEFNDTARNYVRRHLFWATRVGGKVSVPDEARIQGKRTILESYFEGAQLVKPRPLDRLLTCLPDESLEVATAMMVAKRVPSILVVDDRRHPLGIVTSINLLKEIVVAGGSASSPVKSLISGPVHTVAPESSAAAAILLMLRQRISLVCVTEDGTPESKALDVCTYKDLLARTSRHPAFFLNQIRRARTVSRLREICDEIELVGKSYLEAKVSGILVGQIFAELNDVLIERLIALTLEELADSGKELPQVDWAWMSIGSDGRREQILRTDMDNAMVFASTGDPAKDEAIRNELLAFNSSVIDKFVACGFARCQGGVMSSNPRWCRSETEWANEMAKVNIENGEDVLRASILLDMRFVEGKRSLCLDLRKSLFSIAAKNAFLLRRFAEIAVATPPPLSFFGKFLVEKKGSNVGEFDIKAKALSPLRDAARVFAIQYNLTSHHSTGGRLEELGEAVPELREIAQHAYGAYDFLLQLRNLTGLERHDSGRYITPSKLSKLDRAQLSNIFDVVRMTQQAVRRTFHLDPRIS